MQRLLPITLATIVVGTTACANRTAKNVTSVAQIQEIKGKNGNVVTYDIRGRGAYIVGTGASGVTHKICAEPAPDAAADQSAESSSSTKANIDALIKAVTIKAAMENTRDERATSTIVDVANRTEVLLVLRSALYRLCELNINGVLDNSATANAFDYVLRTARLLGQRDNVAKLIEGMKEEDDPKVRADMLRVIVALSYAETVNAATGVAANAGAAGTLLQDAYQKMFAPSSGTRAVKGKDGDQ